MKTAIILDFSRIKILEIKPALVNHVRITLNMEDCQLTLELTNTEFVLFKKAIDDFNLEGGINEKG